MPSSHACQLQALAHVVDPELGTVQHLCLQGCQVTQLRSAHAASTQRAVPMASAAALQGLCTIRHRAADFVEYGAQCIPSELQRRLSVSCPHTYCDPLLNPKAAITPGAMPDNLLITS